MDDHSTRTQAVSDPSTHALENIRFIRETMERSVSFTAVPGWGVLVMGVTAVVAAVFADGQASYAGWGNVWVVEAFIAATIGVATLILKARGLRLPVFSGAGRKFAFSLAPTLIAAALMTIVIFPNPSFLPLFPAMWLLLYGAGITAAGTSSIGLVRLMGLSFMVLGTVALFTPPEWGNWLMGIGFGGLHILFGLIIAIRYGG